MHKGNWDDGLISFFVKRHDEYAGSNNNLLVFPYIDGIT